MGPNSLISQLVSLAMTLTSSGAGGYLGQFAVYANGGTSVKNPPANEGDLRGKS